MTALTVRGFSNLYISTLAINYLLVLIHSFVHSGVSIVVKLRCIAMASLRPP